MKKKIILLVASFMVLSIFVYLEKAEIIRYDEKGAATFVIPA